VRLRDLQVVVAHRDAGAWLEPVEVPHAGRGEDRAVASVALSIEAVQLQLVEALEVPRERAARAVDLEAVPDVGPYAGAAVLQGSPGAVPEAHQAGRVVLVLDGAHLAALDDEVARAHALRHLRPLPDERLLLGRDALDGADEVLGHVTVWGMMSPSTPRPAPSSL
jgi:hypothetical protein